MSSFQERISLLDAELNGGPAGLEEGSGHQRPTAQLEDSYRAVSIEWDYLIEWRNLGAQIRQSNTSDPAELLHEHAEVGQQLIADAEDAAVEHLGNMERLFHSGMERLAGAGPERIQSWQSAWRHELDEFHEEVRLMRNTALLPYPEPPQAQSQSQPQQHASQAHAPQQPTPAVVASAAHSAVASSARTSRPDTPNPPSGSASSHSASPPSPRSASSSRPVSPPPGPSGPKPNGKR
ncbi:hypothetical protein GCM10009863_36380 [Streptomyces axinellae]|uniref:Uncharacterized protein n=1 Tax=Streptomyces axinellae TaxID=552788 RepID=A0ABP6CJR1_9ACTN